MDDQPPTVKRHLVELVKELFMTAAVYIFGGIIIVTLLIAYDSANPWIYHPVYFACFFVPGAGSLYHAIKGRHLNPEPSRLISIINWVGTTGFVIIGIVFLALYFLALYGKIA